MITRLRAFRRPEIPSDNSVRLIDRVASELFKSRASERSTPTRGSLVGPHDVGAPAMAIGARLMS